MGCRIKGSLFAIAGSLYSLERGNWRGERENQRQVSQKVAHDVVWQHS